VHDRLAFGAKLEAWGKRPKIRGADTCHVGGRAPDDDEDDDDDGWEREGAYV
jgi:hypothetical protein